MRGIVAAAVGAMALMGGAVQAATPRDALVMAWNLDALITFDPAQIAEVNGNDIIRNVCEPMVNYDLKDTSKIVPGTIAKWAVSEDGLTLTMTLRDDLKFPSGKKATAQDAEWSLHRAVMLGFGNAANITEWGFNKDNIATNIKATGEHTLVFKLDRPYPVGLLLSAMFASGSTGILDRDEGTKNAKVTRMLGPCSFMSVRQ